MFERIRRAAGVAVVLLCCVAVVQAGGQGDKKADGKEDGKDDGKGNGTLVGSGGTASYSAGEPVGGVIQLDPMKLHCGPKYIGQVGVQQMAGMGVKTPAQLGALMMPLDKPMILHKLALQLYEGEKVVWQTDVNCGGCGNNKKYGPVKDEKAMVGYVFRLDAKAQATAVPFFAKATSVGLVGVGHGGGRARFAFVNVGKQ